MTDVKKRNTLPINNMMKIKSPLLRTTKYEKAGKSWKKLEKSCSY
jgi:hypothetical protein